MLNEYAKSTAVTVRSTKAIEAKDVEFDGIHWKLARFQFDPAGHVASVQLVADGDVATELKSKLADADSPLWNPMGDDLDRVSEGGASGTVMICGNGEETTLTYGRPPSVEQPLTITASNDTLADLPTG